MSESEAREGPFQGMVAVVSGGTQGLGEATARLVAERGAAGVVVVGRNPERGEEPFAPLFLEAISIAYPSPCR